jgi:hypothetical protein
MRKNRRLHPQDRRRECSEQAYLRMAIRRPDRRARGFFVRSEASAYRPRAERPGQLTFIRNRRAGRVRSSEWLGGVD